MRRAKKNIADPKQHIRLPTYPLQGIDENHLLYGNYIGLQYVFAKGLDTDLLERAILDICAELPVLQSRYDQSRGLAIGLEDPPKLRINPPASGHAKAHAQFGTVQTGRAEFITEPPRAAVQSGLAPLSTFTLTPFETGGCILGIAISHALVDAAGFHLIARRFAQIYSAAASYVAAPPSALTRRLDVFKFGTERTKSETLAALKQNHLAKPIKIKGLLGQILRPLIIKAMDKIAHNPRVVILFSPEDTARLKDTVLAESGEPWISTNVALSAHFTGIMSKLMYGARPRKRVQIGQLFDLRHKYFKEDLESQKNIFGNAILIHTDVTEFKAGIQATPRGELARVFKSGLAKIDPAFVQARIHLIADCLRHGYSYPGLDMKNPMIALNNQTKMAVYDLEFSGQSPLRVIPQDVGDNIMFFPTPDGGTEIYIRDIMNPIRQEQLLAPGWQKQIFDF